MLKALLDAKASHGPPSIAHLTRYYNIILYSATIYYWFDYYSVDSPWHSIWQGLLEHMRLLFQCGRSLEDISTVFSAPLGIDKTKVHWQALCIMFKPGVEEPFVGGGALRGILKFGGTCPLCSPGSSVPGSNKSVVIFFRFSYWRFYNMSVALIHLSLKTSLYHH